MWIGTGAKLKDSENRACHFLARPVFVYAPIFRGGNFRTSAMDAASEEMPLQLSVDEGVTHYEQRIAAWRRSQSRLL